MTPDVLHALQLLNAAVVIVIGLGAPILLVWGRKYFADREEPGKIRADLNDMKAEIRQELSNGISRVDAHAIQQFGAISTQLADVKRTMEGALERAHAAHDQANNAIHKAEMAENKIEALDRLLTTRLDHFQTQMRGIEELIRAQAAAARDQRERRQG